MEGTYGFVFRGATGVGMGIFRVRGSEFIGADLAGVRYRGRVTQSASGEITLVLEMSVPTGVFLVQGTSSQDVTYMKSVTLRVPADFGDGKPLDVTIPPGPVTLMAKRIPDEWAPYADGMRVDVRPLMS